jgi:hypothetical protein
VHPCYRYSFDEVYGLMGCYTVSLAK